MGEAYEPQRCSSLASVAVKGDLVRAENVSTARLAWGLVRTSFLEEARKSRTYAAADEAQSTPLPGMSDYVLATPTTTTKPKRVREGRETTPVKWQQLDETEQAAKKKLENDERKARDAKYTEARKQPAVVSGDSIKWGGFEYAVSKFPAGTCPLHALADKFNERELCENAACSLEHTKLPPGTKLRDLRRDAAAGGKGGKGGEGGSKGGRILHVKGRGASGGGGRGGRGAK